MLWSSICRSINLAHPWTKVLNLFIGLCRLIMSMARCRTANHRCGRSHPFKFIHGPIPNPTCPFLWRGKPTTLWALLPSAGYRCCCLGTKPTLSVRRWSSAMTLRWPPQVIKDRAPFMLAVRVCILLTPKNKPSPNSRAAFAIGSAVGGRARSTKRRSMDLMGKR